jgi:uncharacterized protein YfaS (alpha-2-macroglobulin family)
MSYDIKPAVELIGKGVILPNTKGLIFPFKAVNLRAVEVKVIKVYEDNVAQFLQVNQFDGYREMKPHEQTINDMPIRLYGVQNIEVEDPKTRLAPLPFYFLKQNLFNHNSFNQARFVIR